MPLKFAANLSTLFTEDSFLDRFGRAARAGFSAVEFLFPYDAGLEAVKSRLEGERLTAVLFNLRPGDTAAGEWGMLSNPYRRDYFRWSFQTALEAAAYLKCGRLNVMFGQRVSGLPLEAQLDCACENLAWAAPQASEAGVLLLVEPLNETDFPHYSLRRTAAALEVIRRVNHPQVRLQYDVYHAQMTEGNLIHTITTNLASIGHIQVADVPGRHQPGTGEINFPALFAALEHNGYESYVGLEYRPLGESDTSLDWLPRAARG